MLALDATVLINFGLAEAFSVLRAAFGDRLIVVAEVIDEVQNPISSAALREAMEAGWIRRHELVTATELAWLLRLKERTPRLGSGELASLAACLANGWVLASDDRDARRLARALLSDAATGITGSIGLLLDAIDREVITLVDAERFYQAMIANGFRAPFDRLADLLPVPPDSTPGG